MRAIVISFTAGFVIGQVWAIAAYQFAAADGVTFRLLVLALLEAAVAAASFAWALIRFSTNRSIAASLAAMIVAALSGVIANALTVGTFALVPVVADGNGQLFLYIAAVAVVSAMLGGIQGAVSRAKEKNDG